MKKILIVLMAFIFLSGCAALKPKPVPPPPPAETTLEDLQRLAAGAGTNKARAFTALTGGVTGALDKIAVADLTDGDLSFVVTGNTLYVYQFNDAATNAESSPQYIRPDDFTVDGVHYLVAGYFAGLNTLPSTTPGWSFYDLDATAGDVNGKIYLDCSDVGDGTEDCDIYFQVQIAGAAAATVLKIDADGNIEFSLPVDLGANNLVTTGTISGGVVTTQISSLPHTVTAAQIKGHWLRVTAAGDVDLPSSAAVGDIICVEQGGVSYVVSVAVGNASHDILLDGVLLGVNNEIDSPGGAGDAGAYICLHYTETNLWRVRGKQGTWVDGGTVD
jgi:hypothetical protein